MASKLAKIFCKATISGSKRFPTVDFDLATYPKNSIWFRAVVAEADRTKISRADAARIYGIKRTFACISAESREQLRLSHADFTRETFQQLLRDIDLEIGGVASWSSSTQFDNASRWRGFLAKSSSRLGDGTPVANTLDGYRTPLTSISPGRQRPVDKRLPQPTFSGNLISVIPHTTPEELRKKARMAVRERLDSIADACVKELKLYQQIQSYQEECLKLRIPKLEREHLHGIITGKLSVGTKRNKRWFDYPHEWIVAVALKHIDSATSRRINPLKARDDGTYADLILPTSRTLDGPLEFDHYQFQSSNQPWYFARHRLPNKTMTAMFVLLLERTGWNPGGLGALTTDGIKRTGGLLVIQGFKGKTDDYTPPFDVPRDDTWVRTVIVMLERNLKYLIKLGVVPATEKRLWFGWQRKGYNEITNHLHQVAIKRLCEKHDLSHFAPTELRPLNAADTYLETQDLKMVQILLGHSDPETSEAYLNSSLMFHLNEAEALQYQRTIEATLIFSTRGEQALVMMKLDPKSVDKELLYPTGDGGACKDPYAAPYEQKEGETCDGLRCHLNGGCPNYKPVVNAKTLEMAIRTREMYRTRWPTLMRRNETAFRKLHIPRIVYLHVLLKIVAEKQPKLLDRAIKQFGATAVR